MSQSPTVPCQQIKHLDNSSPIADLVSFGSVTRRFGQYSEVNSSIHLYVVLGASHKIHNIIFYGFLTLFSSLICYFLQETQWQQNALNE